MIPEWTVETRTGLRKKKDDILIDLKRERRKRKTLTRRKSAKPKMDFSEINNRNDQRTSLDMESLCLYKTRLVLMWRHLEVTFSLEEFDSISLIKSFMLQTNPKAFGYRKLCFILK